MLEEDYKDPTLEDVPIYFSSKEELLDFTDNLKFFDELLHPDGRAWIKFEENPTLEKTFKVLREQWVVNRLLTMQRYLSLKDFEKNWYKNKLSRNTPSYPDEASEKLQLMSMGPHIKADQWDIYEQVFIELFELHQEKLATALGFEHEVERQKKQDGL